MRRVFLTFGLVLLAVSYIPVRASEHELWLYCSKNLWVDRNLDEIDTLIRRAAGAGYTRVLLTDSKFAKLGDMDARYFRNDSRAVRVQ